MWTAGWEVRERERCEWVVGKGGKKKKKRERSHMALWPIERFSKQVVGRDRGGRSGTAGLGKIRESYRVVGVGLGWGGVGLGWGWGGVWVGLGWVGLGWAGVGLLGWAQAT